MEAPELPGLPGDEPWPEPTRRWWAALAAHPHAGQLTELDWQYCTDTALLHADLWGNFNLDRASEVRARMDALSKRLGEIAAASPPKREATPLDELAKRRAGRGARAAGRARP